MARVANKNKNQPELKENRPNHHLLRLPSANLEFKHIFQIFYHSLLATTAGGALGPVFGVAVVDFSGRRSAPRPANTSLFRGCERLDCEWKHRGGAVVPLPSDDKTRHKCRA